MISETEGGKKKGATNMVNRQEQKSKKVSILGFAGSLRKNSFNKSLLRAALEVLPGDVDLEIFDLEGIAPFNQDLENQPSERLQEFKAKIRAADGILIATPEYNYSVPGVLKNALDAASRPYGDNPFDGKPAAIMGASIGMLGTARAQYHLRQTLVFFNMHPLNRPEVMVPFADKQFDEKGRLTDDHTRSKVKELLEALSLWIKKLSA
ncbi:MAG: NAD(P)H-dependent oxidoreductase [Syntrophales bacterium]